MKTTAKKTSNTVLLAAICSIAITLIGCKGCEKSPPDYHKYIKTSEGPHVPADTTQQIVIWRTPNSDPGYLNKWLDSIYRKCGPFNITVFCGSCDSSLMLLTGIGIKTYIQGTGGGKGGGTSCTVNCPSGGGDTIYWCVNFPVESNDPLDSLGYSDTVPVVIPPRFPFEPITVAVFDTGIDTVEMHRYLYRGTSPSCLDPDAGNGWNFIGSNNIVFDDYPAPDKYGHGAIVASLIAQQVNHYNMNDVRILPVKIHDGHGASDLFSVLCGFAYAKERGAKIINASFGYYAPKQPPLGGVPQTDPGALLLKKYIEYYLTNQVVPTNDNILVIAAAGNINQASVNPERNLDNISFYPASLAAEMSNVIAVTTVDNTSGTVSPHQNYSSNVVDIGVNADVIISDAIHGDHYDFHNPRIDGHQSEGSSYATPILTGIICSHYREITQNLPPGTALNKDDMWRILFQPRLNLGHLTTLSGKIKTGVMMNNARTP